MRSIAITISDINVIWDEVEDATSYEVVIIDPDNVRRMLYTDAKVTSYLFRSLDDDASYRIKVRARSSIGYGKYSEAVMRTLKISKILGD